MLSDFTDCPPRVLAAWTFVIAAGGAYYAWLGPTDTGRPRAPQKSSPRTWTSPSASSMVVFFLALVTVVPTLAYLYSFERGMALVSWIYPSHQDPAPFLARKERIYSHMVFASTAILIGPLQLWAGLRRSSVRLHRALGLVFSISAAASCAASVSYAAHQAYGNDGGFAGTVSFGFMALAVLCYVARGLIFLVDESARGKRGHGRAMIRAYLCFLGDGLFFRVLANYYLPLRTVGNGYAAWTTSIWISWAMPLLLYEVAEAAWDAAGAASSLPAGTEAAR